jgi:hypothetical protein
MHSNAKEKGTRKSRLSSYSPTAIKEIGNCSEESLVTMSSELLVQVKTYSKPARSDSKIKENKLKVENLSLQKKIQSLEEEKENLAKRYKLRIKKLRKRYCEESSCYTSEQKKLMIQDYESLLSTLEEAHLMLKQRSKFYKSIADEKDHSSSEILQLMLEHLELHYQDTKERHPARRLKRSEGQLTNSLVKFKPKKNLNSSVRKDS